jgi:molybdopterin synthase sulfur carrier subunit
MAVVVRLPGSMREAAGGESKLTAKGSTLAAVLEDIEARHPGFRGRVLDDDGQIRSYVNVYIGDEDARAKGGADAPVPEGSEVMVIPAMAGGSG